MKTKYSLVLSMILVGRAAVAGETLRLQSVLTSNHAPSITVPAPVEVKCRFEENRKGGRDCEAIVQTCFDSPESNPGRTACERRFVVTCGDDTIYNGPFGAAAFSVSPDLPAFLIFAEKGTPPTPSAPELYVEGQLGTEFEAFARLRFGGDDAINGFCRGTAPGSP